jgi:acetyltransferase-like isoleucine patch superfamily enzyme
MRSDVSIGDGSVIGANSVNEKIVVAEAIVAGIAAELLRHFNHLSDCWEGI